MMKNVSNKVAWDVAVKYAMIITVIMIGGLFLTGCGSEYITREYTVRNESELREAFANAENGEVIHITIETDIQLQGSELQVPTGATIILETPRVSWINVGGSNPRSITRVAGEARHFYVPHQSMLRIQGALSIQSQQSASNTSAPRTNRGGITVNGGTFNIHGGGHIRNNRWTEGGAISIKNDGLVNMSGRGHIASNTASSHGGGVSVASGGVLSISGSGNIVDNTTSSHGGGVSVTSGGILRMSGSGNITRNKAYGHGGGVFVNENGHVVIAGSGGIANNTANVNGGGIFANGSEVLIRLLGNGRISGNTAQRGGGVALLNDAQLSRSGAGSVSNNTGGNIEEINDDSNEPVNDEPNIIETPEAEPQPQPENGGSSNQRH